MTTMVLGPGMYFPSPLTPRPCLEASISPKETSKNTQGDSVTHVKDTGQSEKSNFREESESEEPQRTVCSGLQGKVS